MPVAAYNVSGEYAMVKAAAAAGYLDERAAVLEALTVDPPRRRRHRHHLPREGRRPMASDLTATPKIRSRKDGAADPARRPRPRAAQPDAGRVPDRAAPVRRASPSGPRSPEERGPRARPAPARRADHPPGHADLRHARARLRLDARRGARSTPSTRGAPRRSSTRTPASRTTTCATTSSTCGSRSRSRRTRSSACRARSTCSQELTGAESIRQLPTLKLFKIRMDLEMEGDTDDARHRRRRGDAGRARARSPTTTSTSRVIRATQGDLPVVPEPYAPAAARARHHRRRAARPPAGHAGARPAAPRRRDPLPPPRRLLRQRHGRLEGARRPDPRDRPADGRRSAGSRHCYQRPTYADWPYQLFTMAHGRSKEECDAILDAIADATPGIAGPRDALLARPSSRRSASCTSPTTSAPGSASTRGV